MRYFLPIFFFCLVPSFVFAVSPNELFEDGGFDALDIKIVAGTEQGVVLEGDNRVWQLAKFTHQIEWSPKTPPIWNAEYVLSFRIKGTDLKGTRLSLWNRAPDKHEPIEKAIYSIFRRGTFDWTKEEVRFKMPVGTSRFILFLSHQRDGGVARIDDISIRPVLDAPLGIPKDAQQIGVADREQTCWIWSDTDYVWNPSPTANQNSEIVRPAQKRGSVSFRRQFTLPQGVQKVQAVFCGDDYGSLFINGKLYGANQNSQDITKIVLDLDPGKHEVRFDIDNSFGPGGLAARIEWFDSTGKRSFIASNERWECSTDNGQTWSNAKIVTVLTPAPANPHWLYPHLERTSCIYQAVFPKGATNPRLAFRTTGSFSLRVDDVDPIEGVSAGKQMYIEPTSGAFEKIVVEFSEISQPIGAEGILQYQFDGKTVEIPLDQLTTSAGKKPDQVSLAYPGRGWSHNIASFDSLSTLPTPSYKSEFPEWGKKMLVGSMPLWTLGQADDSAEEFAELKEKDLPQIVEIPLTDLKTCPRGLEAELRPEQTFRFTLNEIPQNGTVFVLNVDDADAIVAQVAVFVNDMMVGMPQVLGYDQVPGERKTNRPYLVTIPKERFHAGANTLTLRLIPGLYQQKGMVVNQSERYVKMANLRSRQGNPYPTSSWLHWDNLSLIALGTEAAKPINGNLIYMGTNMGNTHRKGLEPFEQFVLRDLAYLGMTHSGAPLRVPIWNEAACRELFQEVDGVKVLDRQMQSLRDIGIEPYILFEPGRTCNGLDDFPESFEAQLVKNHGSKFIGVEVGNEVDHPFYGWDQMAMSVSYATIQKQSVLGQELKKLIDSPDFRVIGEGWYHAWNYGVIDAHSRKEALNDPGFTDDLSAHSYGMAYLLPALLYYSLYGANLGDPKPIWVTECGASTPDDNLFQYDINLRGNIAFARYVVQFLAWPDKTLNYHEMRPYGLFSEESADATILEKARIFRRLFHAYAMHGKPIHYRILNETELKNQLVFINPVSVEGGAKLAFVNFTDKSQPVKVELTMLRSGTMTGKRYGDGETVAAATKEIKLNTIPRLVLEEVLAPGETVQYDVRYD